MTESAPWAVQVQIATEELCRVLSAGGVRHHRMQAAREIRRIIERLTAGEHGDDDAAVIAARDRMLRGGS